MADVSKFQLFTKQKVNVKDAEAREALSDIETKKGAANGIASLDENGVLPLSQGGLGANNAKQAQANILGDMNTESTTMTDNDYLVFAYETPTSIGAVFKRTLLQLVNYISSKLKVGEANGIATLDGTGRVPYDQLPESAMTLEGEATPTTPEPEHPVKGMFWVVITAGTIWGIEECEVDDRILYTGTAFRLLKGGAVSSVNGKTGNVQLTAADVGATKATYNATTHTLTLEV